MPRRSRSKSRRSRSRGRERDRSRAWRNKSPPPRRVCYDRDRRSGKSQGKKTGLEIREKSGNPVSSQGKVREFRRWSGKNIKSLYTNKLTAAAPSPSLQTTRRMKQAAKNPGDCVEKKCVAGPKVLFDPAQGLHPLLNSELVTGIDHLWPVLVLDRIAHMSTDGKRPADQINHAHQFHRQSGIGRTMARNPVSSPINYLPHTRDDWSDDLNCLN
ncbi:hypothetical protein J6590_024920 [Homalodisca vitripennis]|nr:hypothetical protein J6590_024920 [Homalodisca vitripennis]